MEMSKDTMTLTHEQEIEALKIERDDYKDKYLMWERRALATRAQAQDLHKLYITLEKKVTSIESEVTYYKRECNILDKVLIKLRTDFPDVICQYCIICKSYHTVFSRENATNKYDRTGFIVCPDCAEKYPNPWNGVDEVSQAQ